MSKHYDLTNLQQITPDHYFSYIALSVPARGGFPFYKFLIASSAIVFRFGVKETK